MWVVGHLYPTCAGTRSWGEISSQSLVDGTVVGLANLWCRHAIIWVWVTHDESERLHGCPAKFRYLRHRNFYHP